jgi:hypothetical protein
MPVSACIVLNNPVIFRIIYGMLAIAQTIWVMPVIARIILRGETRMKHGCLSKLIYNCEMQFRAV